MDALLLTHHPFGRIFSVFCYHTEILLWWADTVWDRTSSTFLECLLDLWLHLVERSNCSPRSNFVCLRQNSWIKKISELLEGKMVRFLFLNSKASEIQLCEGPPMRFLREVWPQPWPHQMVREQLTNRFWIQVYPRKWKLGLKFGFL